MFPLWSAVSSTFAFRHICLRLYEPLINIEMCAAEDLQDGRRHWRLSFYRASETTRSAVLPKPRQVVRLSVYPSVCKTVTLRYRGHVGSNSWKIISQLISLTFSLSAVQTPTWRILQGNTPHFSRDRGGVGKIVDFRHLSRRISETVQNRVQVANCYWPLIGICMYALSIGAKIDDLEWPLSEIQGHWFLKSGARGPRAQVSGSPGWAAAHPTMTLGGLIDIGWAANLLAHQIF